MYLWAWNLLVVAIIYRCMCVYVFMQVCTYLFAIDKKLLKIAHIGDKKLIEFVDVFEKGYRDPRMKVTDG